MRFRHLSMAYPLAVRRKACQQISFFSCHDDRSQSFLFKVNDSFDCFLSTAERDHVNRRKKQAMLDTGLVEESRDGPEGLWTPFEPHVSTFFPGD